MFSTSSGHKKRIGVKLVSLLNAVIRITCVRNIILALRALGMPFPVDNLDVAALMIIDNLFLSQHI